MFDLLKRLRLDREDEAISAKCKCLASLDALRIKHEEDPDQWQFIVIMVNLKTDQIGSFAHHPSPVLYGEAVKEIERRKNEALRPPKL